MCLPALEEEEEQEEEEELDLGGPVVGDFPATLFTCLLLAIGHMAHRARGEGQLQVRAQISASVL